MSLNRLELAAVIAELQAVLPGSFLNKLNAPDRNLVQLVLRPYVVIIDLNPGLTRLHLVQSKRPAPPVPPGWIMKGRGELVGRRLSSVVQVGDDRIARMNFAGRPERGLVVELFGRGGRLLLLDEQDRVLMPLLGRAETGSPYVPPAGGHPPPATSRFGPPDPESLEVNRKVADLYGRMAAEQSLSKDKREIGRRLAVEERRLRRRIGKTEADLARTRQAYDLARQAEALKYRLGAVIRGQRRVSLPDPWDPDGEPVLVELDPAQSPQDNMKRMFSRARRLAAARGPIGQRLGKARNDLEDLRRLAARVMMADSPAALDGLRPGPAPTGSPRKPRRPTRHRPYRMYHSDSGKTIMVGRTGKDNHELTFRVARGHDLWLHTRDAAGAHVIVRLERGLDADEQTLLDAATLAAHNSPLRSSAKVDITYTRVKNVHPIKGAPPGLVSVSKARTILVRMEPERLTRLGKSSKTDDL